MPSNAVQTVVFGAGTTVILRPPSAPVWRTLPPEAGPPLVVVPITGPRGPQGPPGRDGEDGQDGDGTGGGGTGFRHVQSAAAALWQVVHDLGYAPAGVLVRDTLGQLVEPDDITYPLRGVIELSFGAPVAGTVWLS